MRRFLETTWLPTLLFAFPVFLILARWWHPTPAAFAALYVVIVVPPVWWLTTGRRLSIDLSEGIGEGIAGGVLCGLVAGLLPIIALVIVVMGTRSDPGGGWGGLILGIFLMLFIIAAVFLFLGGIVIGALTVLLEWSARRLRPRVRVSS